MFQKATLPISIDDAATKKEVRQLVFDNYLKDLTPPLFYRVYGRVKDKIKRERIKLRF